MYTVVVNLGETELKLTFKSKKVALDVKEQLQKDMFEVTAEMRKEI